MVVPQAALWVEDGVGSPSSYRWHYAIKWKTIRERSFVLYVFLGLVNVGPDGEVGGGWAGMC